MNAVSEKHSDRQTQRLKIGDVAKQTGVGIETLRFYEKARILDPPRRTESGYRLYDAGVLERIAFIKQAQLLGFTLEEIRQLIEHKKAGENPCSRVRQVVRRRLEELDEKLKQMRRYRNELAKNLEEWERIGEKKGHVCGLIESSKIEHGRENKRKLSLTKRKI